MSHRRRSSALGDTPYEHFEQAVYTYKRRNKHVTCSSVVDDLVESQSVYVHALQSRNPKLIALAQKHVNSIKKKARKCIGD